MAEKQIASITLKVDVSEALTGLKALTREARKATAALAELREAVKEPVVVLPAEDIRQELIGSWHYDGAITFSTEAGDDYDE
ncbi:hypothetical protein [Paenibacillus larvae]|uniref:Uncharacterized protein n=6 Tax=root TaxID=1 RepID=A0A345AVL6_9CAUD|nr:hypothetical protein [Paenibacillus larvae]YP_010082340.1 hypothetical protein KMD18_gp86 [Paenibacillus phage Halcyone]YP_010082431.1 hypothetical protein KMD19_gp87 [Paenibacillus phage Scottie]YP_010082509.1 hypothetical protein KMD20_gp74 [Paenibacillus phage Unity]AXF41040.1 hypothetical protein HEATH_86 [Paenibacillus phage Heath]MEB9608213.1 hypothetical protein [Bacillus cereus]MED2910230.1 hypothetical protein [Bacillus thuringiensis]AQZ48371.1 hypothetical protein B5S25_19035 [P